VAAIFSIARFVRRPCWRNIQQRPIGIPYGWTKLRTTHSSLDIETRRHHSVKPPLARGSLDQLIGCRLRWHYCQRAATRSILRAASANKKQPFTALIPGPGSSTFSAAIDTAARPPNLLSPFGEFAAAVCFVGLRAFDGHFTPRLFQRAWLVLLACRERLIVRLAGMVQAHDLIPCSSL
jgi:hypothetical protein